MDSIVEWLGGRMALMKLWVWRMDGRGEYAR